jgi:hypothetical protein
MDSGDGSAGTSSAYARADHVHPQDINLVNSLLGESSGAGNAVTSLSISEGKIIPNKNKEFVDTDSN